MDSNFLFHSGTNFQADHSGPAEDLFGQYIKGLPEAARPFGAAKWAVVHPMEVTFSAVQAAIDERRARMQTDRLDLVQFYWQDYQDRDYLTALQHLLQLRSMGKVRSVGLCDFDTRRTDEICTVLGRGSIASNAVQFSIIDVRPLHGMNHVCERHDVQVLAYGALYLDVILKAWGTWDLFQTLLRTLRDIADRHDGATIANVAVRWVLEHPFVGAVIIGKPALFCVQVFFRARLGLSDHSDENKRVFNFALTDRDKAEIEAVLGQSRSAAMIMTIGDCGAEYRR
ncbi:hypothetical protein ACG7TL_007412 [Trametes sanguinea]